MENLFKWMLLIISRFNQVPEIAVQISKDSHFSITFMLGWPYDFYFLLYQIFIITFKIVSE